MRLLAGFLSCLLSLCAVGAQVTATWTHDGASVEGFRLSYQCDSQIGTVPTIASARSLTFNVPAGEHCAAWMVAYNQVGDSDPSATVTFIVPAAELPGPVQNLHISWAKQVETVADFKIQRGTVNIAPGGITATITAGSDYTAPASTAKAFIRIVSNGQATNGDSVGDFNGIPGRNLAYISNPSNLLTSITLSRTDTNTTNSTGIEWEIIEYIGAASGPNEMLVRDVGVITVGTSDATVAGTTGVTHSDAADVVVFKTGIGVTGGARGESGSFNFTGAFNATTDGAEFTRDNAIRAGNLSYAVVEFTGSNWTVQRIAHTQSAVGAETESISSVGDLSRAFIHIQHATDTSNGPRQLGYEVYLSSTTQITFDVDVQSGGRRFVAWVVSNSQTGSGAMSVARYSGTRAADTGSEPDLFTQAITSVSDVAQTSIMGECANNGTVTTDTHYAMVGFRLTAADTVTMTRGRHRNTRDYRFEVVQWPSTASGTTEVSADSDLRWSLLASIASDSDLRWSALQQINADADLRWSVLQQIARDLELRWDADGSISTVQSDISMQWSVIATIAQSLQLDWSSLQAVTGDADIRWSVLSAATKDISAQWDVLQAIEAGATLQWDVIGMAERTLTLRWSIESDTQFPDITGVITIESATPRISIASSTPAITIH